jgi:rhodanese-related sulfurtransferase
MESDDVIVVDVREPNEYNSGHLPGAKHIPLNTVLNRISEIPTDKQVLFVCGTANRSALAAEMAAAMGLTNLVVIEGGTEGWKRRGFPVEM